MKPKQIPPTLIIFRPNRHGQSEKPKYLTLTKISELIAYAALMTKDDLSEASKGQIYVTNRDELLDFHLNQSVNTNA